MIGTTDLDSARPVTWNMGTIAASQAPGALELFRNIMVASMSIPGAVSPVMIDVEVDGKLFQEMHVDGGVITQMFLYPPGTVMAMNKVPEHLCAMNVTFMSFVTASWNRSGPERSAVP